VVALTVEVQVGWVVRLAMVWELTKPEPDAVTPGAAP
jgi:hypothetical protein